jgi:hypothetical protein
LLADGENDSGDRKMTDRAFVDLIASRSGSIVARAASPIRKSPLPASVGHSLLPLGGLRCVSGKGATSPIEPFGASVHFASEPGLSGPAKSAESSRYVSSRK